MFTTRTNPLPVFSLFMLLIALQPAPQREITSPLAEYSELWNQPKYEVCNTAANASYLSEGEKKVIWVLNLARMDPNLFLETVILKYPEKSDQKQLVNSDYYKSLLVTFKNLGPLPLLNPDSLCFKSAECHAIQSGQSGYVGHSRTEDCQKVSYFSGECCDYGFDEALDILMHLMIDEGLPSLGHREICLDKNYKLLGASIRPHKTYMWNAVLDFKN